MSIQNFKCLEGADLAFERVTLLTGGNSAGKSSVIQALLLLAQSAHEHRLELYGDLVRIGTAHDAIRDNARKMALGLRIGDSENDLSISVEFKRPARHDLKIDVAPASMTIRRIANARTRGRTVLKAVALDTHGAIQARKSLSQIPYVAEKVEPRTAENATWYQVTEIERSRPDRKILILASGLTVNAILINQTPRRTEQDLHSALLESIWTTKSEYTPFLLDGWTLAPGYRDSYPSTNDTFGITLFSQTSKDAYEAWRERSYGEELIGLEPDVDASFRDDFEKRAGVNTSLFDLQKLLLAEISAAEKSLSEQKGQQVAVRSRAHLPDAVLTYKEARRQTSTALHRPWRGLVAADSSNDETVPLFRQALQEVPLPLELAALFRDLLDFSAAARSYAKGIEYLGPLREEPRHAYPSSPPARNASLGVRGERTLEALLRRGDKPRRYSAPGGAPRKGTLRDAVNEWITFFGIAEDYAVFVDGKHGIGLDLTRGQTHRKLPEVGVGVSQLLPIITLVLDAAPGTLVVIEQPELHLHPALQAHLADFFLTARPDIKLVIETHSEYLITRLRLRVAEQSFEAERANLGFVEQNSEGVTSLRRLDLNSLGGLSEWPRGFFDQSESDHLRIIDVVRRRLQSETR